MENSLKVQMQAMQVGNGFAYILDDNNLFMPTEYKVMRSQHNDLFVRCLQMLYNGKIMLLYMPDDMRSLESMMPWLDEEKFCTIAGSVLASVQSVKMNGFLSCENIDIALNRIYVNKTGRKVAFVYLPVAQDEFAVPVDFEAALRKVLVHAIEKYDSIAGAKTDDLLNHLLDADIPIEAVAQSLGASIETPKTAQKKQLTLISVNSPTPHEITVNKDEFYIGRHPQMADGVIRTSNNVGRRHCKIVCGENAFQLVDLESKNHTYIGNNCLPPNVPTPLRDGDVVRFADCVYKAKIT